MPLHLLPKKSWNVYNTDNVERVRRDEAAARAAEEAKEERMQEADATRRLAVLRGEEPPPLPEEEEKPLDPAAGALVKRDRFAGERKKRKRPGEDDTDFEMRLARERAAEVAGRRRTSDALLELAGLLGPGEQAELVGRPGRDEDAAPRKHASAQSLPNPLIKDALGIKQNPWFLKRNREEADESPGHDAWGNEDLGRKTRDAARLDKNDPLAMMRKGAAKVREITKERAREIEERQRELKMLKREERRAQRRRKREDRRREEVEELDGFSLDPPAQAADRSAIGRGHHGEHRHGEERQHDGRRYSEATHHGSGRTERDRHRHRHRHRSREGREREH